jgi:hypothetical protein
MATGSFTATGAGEVVEIVAPKYFDLSIFGTFTGTVQLQRKRPSDSTWRVVKEYTEASEDLEDTGLVASGVWQVRLECTSYTSGTINWELSAQ